MRTFNVKLTKQDGYNVSLSDAQTNEVIIDKNFRGVIAATETLKDAIFIQLLKRKKL